VATGEVPSDAALSRIYGYTPVHAGWIYGDNGKPATPRIAIPYAPAASHPDYSTSALTPRMSASARPRYIRYLAGLGDDTAAAMVSNPDAVAELLRTQRRSFWLQVVTTASIATLTLLAVFRAAR